ncbi:MAG: DUF2341 domain-containing protein [Candidatus Woesearchaeota archaeon]
MIKAGYATLLFEFENDLAYVSDYAYDPSAPTHDNPYITPDPAYPFNNLTCNANNVFDADGDQVVNITTWYKNNRSIYLLYLTFANDNESVLKDYSFHNYDIVNNSAKYNKTIGRIGGSFYFDGNSYIDLGQNIALGENFTIELWYKGSESEYYKGLTGAVSTNGYALQIDQGLVRAWINGNQHYGTSYVNDNIWHHIVLQRENGLARIYVDGILEKEELTSSASVVSNQNTWIGGWGNTDYLINGFIDEIRYYNYSLSNNQIRKNFFSENSSNYNNILLTDEIKINDEIKCGVIPNDGNVSGLLKNSSFVKINENLKPNLTNVYLLPQPAFNDSNLSCYGLINNIEGDYIVNITNWYRNNKSIYLAYFSFTNNNESLLKDYSYNINSAFNNGATYYKDLGKIGGSFYFDGNSYIDLGQNIALGENFTIELWYKGTDDQEYHGLTGAISTNGYGIQLYYGLVRVWINGNVHLGNILVNDDKWHHIVVQREKGQLKSYIDSVLDINETTDTGSVASNQNTWIGGWGNNELLIYGLIDEVKYYNYSLTYNQIRRNFLSENQSLYNNFLDYKETNLNEEWKCSITPNDGYLDGITKNSSSVKIKLNNVPRVSNLQILPITPNTTSNLSCYATVMDNFNFTINVEYFWYNGTNLFSSGNVSVNNNTNTLISTISNSNTKKNEIWNCTIKAYVDLENSIFSLNSTNVKINNNPPTKIRDIENRNWLNDSSYYLNLSIYFIDEDEENLSYNVINSNNYIISFKDNVANITPINGFVGRNIINFTANDGENITHSNPIIIETHNDLIINSNQTWNASDFYKGIYYFRNLYIINNSTLFLRGNYTNNSDGYGVELNIKENLTIEKGSKISADELGYPGGSITLNGMGPGAGIANDWATGVSGAGHGGYGGGINPGSAYDSLVYPIQLGSGGAGAKGSDARIGGNGGGAIIINSSQIKIDGILSANGGSTPCNGCLNPGGGGSGGSILILCNNISGEGNITTNGGSGDIGSQTSSGAGAGGRISIHFKNFSFVGVISSFNGNKGRTAENGTIYLYDYLNNDLYIIRTQLWRTNLEGDLFNHNNIYILNRSTLYLKSYHTNDTNGIGFKFYVKNFYLLDNASINLNGLGYSGGDPGYNGYGPGKGISNSWPIGVSGAGHGGLGGGVNGGFVYDSYDLPLELGSGGAGGKGSGSMYGGNGGGAILINATNNIIINGSINADGGNTYNTNSEIDNPGGGGSGGSILLICNNFFSNGFLTARGGNGGSSQTTSGNGGGGRISVIYLNNFDFNLNNNITTPGVGGSGGESGTSFILHYFLDINFNVSHLAQFPNDTIIIYGKANLSEGTNVSNRNLIIRLNETIYYLNTSNNQLTKTNTGILPTTNLTGGFYYILETPSEVGSYLLRINTSEFGKYGYLERTKNLTINITRSFVPQIIYHNTYPNKKFFDSNKGADYYYIYANVSDYDNNVVSVNFTLIAPNGTVVIDNKNASAYSNNLWNSTSFKLDQYGQWNYTVFALDNDGNNDTNYGNIRFLEITGNIQPSYILINQSFILYGVVKDSLRNPVSEKEIFIYVNNSLINKDDWWNSSWIYRKKIYVEPNVQTNLTNTITLVNFSTSEFIAQNKMRSDCGDVRFTDSNNSELQYTMETSSCNSNNTIFWIWTNLTANSNNTIYAYFGNPNANFKKDYFNPDNSLIVYYHFDNPSIYSSDISKSFDFSRNYNGSLYNGAYVISDGKFEKGVYLDGVDDNFATDNMIPITGTANRTVMLWLKVFSDSNGGIFQLGNNGAPSGVFSLFLENYNIKYWGHFQDYTTNAYIYPGSFTHLAITFNGSNVVIYLNGTIVDNRIISVITRQDIARFGYTTLTGYLQTIIDEVRIYNRSLSQDEISTIYNSTKIFYVKNEIMTSTNFSGEYSYIISAPSNVGKYFIKINTTYNNYNNEYGEQTLELDLKKIPKILSNNTFPLKVYFDNNNPISMYLQANVEDENLYSVNFTLIAPNGTVVIDNKNASAYSNNLWNSTSFKLDQYGQWNYSVFALDNDGNNDTSYGNIRFLQITETLEPNYVNVNQTVAVFGNVKDTNENFISNNSIYVYLNNESVTCKDTNWWNYSFYNVKQFTISNPSSYTLTNAPVYINFSTLDLIYQNKLKTNCQDIRFVDETNNEIDYILDIPTCNSSKTSFLLWLNLSGNENKTLYAYYGNNEAYLNKNYNIPDKSLILYYNFDNNTVYHSNANKIYDLSKNNYNSSFINGATVSSEGKNGYALYLDGYDDFIHSDTTLPLEGNKERTIMMWIKTFNDDRGGIFQIGKESWPHSVFTIYLNGGYRIAYWGHYVDYNTNAYLYPGGWSHLAVTFNQTNIKIYINGTLSDNNIVSVNTYNPYLRIGHAEGLINNYLNCMIDEIFIFNRSLEYPEILSYYNLTKIYFISNNTNLKTNSSGHYLCNITSPLIPGQYVVKVNTTYNDEYGEQTQILTVKQFPKLLENYTSPRKVYFDSNSQPLNVSIIANISDDNLKSVNFTLIAPNGTVVIDNKNASAYSGSIWNSTSFKLDQYGQWNYSVFALDNDGNNDSSYGNIRFLQISETLEPNYVNVNQTVAVFGNVKNSSRYNINDKLVFIYLNNSLLTTLDWWNNSWYYKKIIFIESNVQSNLTNTITLVNFSTSEFIAQNKMRSDCGDVRFTDSNNNELQYTMETSTCNSSNTIFWVWTNLTANSNNTIYAYFGNPNATLKTDYTNPDDSLVLYLHFDNSSYYGENNSKMFDFSKKGNNGTCINCPSLAKGIYGNYYDFDETNKYITINADLKTQNNKVTVMAWVNLDSTSESGNFIKIGGGNNGFGIGVGQTTTEDNGNNLIFIYEYVRWINTGYSIGTGWHHVAMTIDANGIPSAYIDGRFKNSFPGNAPISPDSNIVIGGNDIRNVDAGIDEIRVYNKTLSEDEISAIYNTTKNYYISNETFAQTNSSGDYYYTFNAPLIPGQYVVKVNATYNDEYGEQSRILNVVESYNPKIVNINISPFNAKTNDDLICIATINSFTNITVEYYWYNGSNLIFSGNNTNVLNNVPQVITTLNNDYTKKGENWTCTIRAYNGIEYSSYNSSSVIIQNTPPSTPNLISPTNNNNTVWTNPPEFIWSSFDEDNDLLNFTLNITSEICPDILIENITSFNYNPLIYLPEIEFVLNCPYKWQVRVSDGTNYSEWSEKWNFTIEPILILTLINNSIDFGNLNINDVKDTDNNVSQMIIRNDGNLIANITYISINNSLWESVSDNTEYFQFKIDNVSYEPNSFNWTLSTTNWTNLTFIFNTNKTAVAYLLYQDKNDEAEIDYRIKVPPGERAGEKRTTILIIGEDT